MSWFPIKRSNPAHHKCEGHEKCPYWAYTMARRTPQSEWHWYCDKCAGLIAQCGWETSRVVPSLQGDAA